MNFPVGTAIPDGNPTGLSDTRTIGSPITSIDSLRVSLTISGGVNGDLYAHVTHATGFSVLLNRTGKTTLDAFGYDDTGFQVTFDDTALNGNVHLYRDAVVVAPGSPLVGTFAPDGRAVNPNDVLDTDVPSAFLTSFNGVDPNGDWTLFVADLAGGDAATLESWDIEFTGVPEPRATVLAMGCLLLVGVAVRRASRGAAS